MFTSSMMDLIKFTLILKMMSLMMMTMMKIGKLTSLMKMMMRRRFMKTNMNNTPMMMLTTLTRSLKTSLKN